MQFARENSTPLPSVDPIFKIMKRQPNGKRKMKTALNLDRLSCLSLASGLTETMIEYNKFQETLNKLSV